MEKDQIELADWIMSIRAQLTEAAIAQQERERSSSERGKRLPVPPLKVKELRLELEVCTERVASNKVAGETKLRFWVLPSIGASAEAAHQRQAGTTQKLILTLEPITVLKLGPEGETEYLR